MRANNGWVLTTVFILARLTYAADSNHDNYQVTGEEKNNTSVTSSKSLDPAAHDWWMTHGTDELKKLGESGGKLGLPRHTLILVHLPSGEPAFPFPAAITEDMPVQIAIILPKNKNSKPHLTIKSCEDVQPFRTTFGTTEPQKGPTPVPKSETYDFSLFPVGQFLKCGAGKLTYSISSGIEDVNPKTPKNSNLDATAVEANKDQLNKNVTGEENGQGNTDDGIKIRVRPKFHLAAIVTGGWDFAGQPSFEKNATSDPKSFTIARVNNSVGPALYVGIEWMIGGVDYEDMQWYNYFANIIVAANPKSPLDDLLVGLSITPIGSLGIVFGTTFHSGTRLKGGYKTGDNFTGDGDIPVETTWKSPGIGLYIGLNLDSRILDAVKAKFSSK